MKLVKLWEVIFECAKVGSFARLVLTNGKLAVSQTLKLLEGNKCYCWTGTQFGHAYAANLQKIDLNT